MLQSKKIISLYFFKVITENWIFPYYLSFWTSHSNMVLTYLDISSKELEIFDN